MPTFYLSNLNPGSASLNAAGEFGGAVTTQPVTTSATHVINITTATAQSYFKFYNSGSGRVGVLTGENGSGFTYPATDTTRSDHFIELLANEVFGSSESGDLFSNKVAITTSWNSASVVALGDLQGLVNALGNGDDAAEELVNAMFFAANDTTKRYTMPYGFANADGANPIVTGTEYVVSTAGASTGAKVNVTMKDGGDAHLVKSITVHTGGTGYTKGEVITITDTQGTPRSATITLNSYQAASLIAGTGAGTLSHTSGVEVPLEATDVIRVLFTIVSKSDQEDTSGDVITATQTFFVDYTLN